MVAEGGEILDCTERDELAGLVANGGALDGVRDHRQARGVGCGLTEEAILGTAADDENAGELALGPCCPKTQTTFRLRHGSSS